MRRPIKFKKKSMSCSFWSQTKLKVKLLWINQHQNVARKTRRIKRCDGGLATWFQASMSKVVVSQCTDRHRDNRAEGDAQTRPTTEMSCQIKRAKVHSVSKQAGVRTTGEPFGWRSIRSPPWGAVPEPLWHRCVLLLHLAQISLLSHHLFSALYFV